MAWETDQEWERNWWGNCCNTYAEETKQLTYAHRMGLVNEPRDGMWPVYDLGEKTILDIGGGPTSMLLRTVNGKGKVVQDPCEYPDWVMERYATAGITYLRYPGEQRLEPVDPFDEVWIYNVLQHTEDPETIIKNALEVGKLIRIFEWIDLPPHMGHPQELKAHLLLQWLGADHGTIEQMNENGCNSRAFYGVFSGRG
jgi:2-polyprenyl-3-methyl-5-hydroxy-6-metoxy-1,4-benzoquinol methylase